MFLAQEGAAQGTGARCLPSRMLERMLGHPVRSAKAPRQHAERGREAQPPAGPTLCLSRACASRERSLGGRRGRACSQRSAARRRGPWGRFGKCYVSIVNTYITYFTSLFINIFQCTFPVNKVGTVTLRLPPFLLLYGAPLIRLLCFSATVSFVKRVPAH